MTFHNNNEITIIISASHYSSGKTFGNRQGSMIICIYYIIHHIFNIPHYELSTSVFSMIRDVNIRLTECSVHILVDEMYYWGKWRESSNFEFSISICTVSSATSPSSLFPRNTLSRECWRPLSLYMHFSAQKTNSHYQGNFVLRD